MLYNYIRKIHNIEIEGNFIKKIILSTRFMLFSLVLVTPTFASET